MNGNVKKPVLSPEELKKLLVPEAPVVIPRLGNWWQWVNLALLFLTLEVAVYSIERAQWIYPQPAFTLLLFLSMLLVWLLVVARLHWALTHGIAVVTGVLVTIWQSIILLPGTHSIGHLFNVFQLWWQGSAGALLPEEQKVVFAAVLTLLTWLLGYLATWFVLRKNNPWVAICLGALILIANLSNLPARYYFFFPAFFIAAVFLIIQTRIAGQFVRSGRGSGYSFKSVIYLFASLVCIISLAASLAWYSPQARASGLQSYISARFTWKQNLTDSKINIFNVIPAKQVMNTSSTLKEVDFEKGWNQGQTLHFTIKSDRPAYWPIDIYDSYTAQGWINGPTTSQLVDAKKPFTDLGPNLDDVMNYEVTTEINTDVLAVAGNFVASSEPVQVHQNAAGDVTEVTIPRILAPGEHYTVETVLPNPTADQLAAAGTGYPQNILDSYLQLPANYSPEVQALSENVTAAAATPYEKARAVVKYLSAFPYQAIINAPPAGSDGVAYFLPRRPRQRPGDLPGAGLALSRLGAGLFPRLRMGELRGYARRRRRQREPGVRTDVAGIRPRHQGPAAVERLELSAAQRQYSARQRPPALSHRLANQVSLLRVLFCQGAGPHHCGFYLCRAAPRGALRFVRDHAAGL
ncbi:MAG: hypothetical protein ABR886_03380 [Dehalococcoidales bacterium]